MIEIPSVWIERKIGESRFRLFKFLPPYIKWLFFIIQTSISKKMKKIICWYNWKKFYIK